MAWNRPNAANQPTVKNGGAKAPSKVRGIVAGLVTVVALGALCVFMFTGNEDMSKPKSNKNVGRIKEVKPATVQGRHDSAPEEASKEDPALAERRARLAKMTIEERINFLFEEMQRQPYNLESSSGKPYRNGLEQIMSWMFTRELGDMPPVLPSVPIRDEAHLVAILVSPNEVVEGDSEKVKQAKAAVEVAKKELIKYIKEGGDVHSFLEYYHSQLVQANRTWKDSMMSVNNIIKTDPEIAVDYFNKVNDSLADKGIKPVVPNKKILQLAEEQGIELKHVNSNQE